MQFASIGTLLVKMSSEPSELIVLRRHQDSLTRLMKGSIDRIKQRLFSKGMLSDSDIDDQYEILSKMERMRKVLMSLREQMKEESEEESKRIFDKFLDILDEEAAWGNLKKSLCKCAVNATFTLHVLVCRYQV